MTRMSQVAPYSDARVASIHASRAPAAAAPTARMDAALSVAPPAGDQRRAGVGRQRARRGRRALRVAAPRRVVAAARRAREAQVGGAGARQALPRRRRAGGPGALLRRRRHQGTPRRDPTRSPHALPFVWLPRTALGFCAGTPRVCRRCCRWRRRCGSARRRRWRR